MLLIRDPHVFEGYNGKVVVTVNGRVVCRGEAQEDLWWDVCDLKAVAPTDSAFHYLGQYNGEQIFTLELAQNESDQLSTQIMGLRAYVGVLPDSLFHLLGRAIQINEWYRGHRYCGRCGERTGPVGGERALGCAQCGSIYYPRLSPCVMALITKGDECLLAHNRQWKSSLYSVLAGFIEPGESVEDALRREVKEEVDITVGALHYQGSQPWPFPGQIMMGFFADYHSGEIQADGVEIADAQWFHYSKLPEIPGQFSLSGQLIRRFVSERQGRET